MRWCEIISWVAMGMNLFACAMSTLAWRRNNKCRRELTAKMWEYIKKLSELENGKSKTE